MILLLGSMSFPAAAQTLDAPRLEPWPEKLPAAENRPGGVFLPGPRAKVVLGRLRFLEAYPVLCQGVIDGNRRTWDTKAQEIAKAAEAAARARFLATEVDGLKRWPLWQVGIVSGGALVVGAAIGWAVSTLIPSKM